MWEKPEIEKFLTLL